MKNKKAQLKLSFGMIFSIILIIIFISFAIYGISKFLKLQKTVQVKKFSDDLQYDIDKIWRGGSSSQSFEYTLPSNMEKVCFNNQGVGDNMEIMKKGGGFGGGYSLEHINIEKDFCAGVIDGKIKIIMSKSQGEALVTISK